MNEILKNIIDIIKNNNLVKVTFSNNRNKNSELEKVIGNLVIIKNIIYFQLEYRYTRIIKHKNLNITNIEDIENEINELILNFKDINIQSTTEIINVKISKKYKVSINKKTTEQNLILKSQNKIKNYYLSPNKIYGFLVELGIQSKEGKIKNDKYNKFKQINKYLEFIDNVIKKLNVNKKIRILDFGSGKSYLTFAIYYYFKIEKNIDVEIIGVDLKKEVINNCNKIAKKLNYSNLSFVFGDINNFENTEEIDILISLHACNIATDIALIKAIKWNVKSILAVPCCHKEINNQIKVDYLPLILKHGILKEKFSSMLTDSIRNEILEVFGYKSEIIEFISEANTPKNILIRALKKRNYIDKEKLKEIKNYLKLINIELYLIKEIEKIAN